MTEGVEPVGPLSHISGYEGDRVVVVADAVATETVGDRPRQRRIDRSEEGATIDVMTQVIEQVGSKSHVRRGKGQGVEVGADREKISGSADSAAWFDHSELRDAPIVMPHVVEINGAVTNISRGEGNATDP